MNTKEALKQLNEAFNNCKVHKSFIKEISSLLKKELSGKEKTFFKILFTQLAHINTFGRMIYTVDGHERLKGTDGLYYSIHLQQSQFNVRLLIRITESNTVYFLCAFYERSGKKNTDYSTYTNILDQRFAELLGGDNNE